MKENCYALIAAIFNPDLTVDKALMAMGVKSANEYSGRPAHSYLTWGTTCFILHAVCGLSYSDISSKLGLDRKTVRKAISSFKENRLI